MADNGNWNVDFKYLKQEATKCKDTCIKKINTYNKELDDLIIKELQPYWKSKKANKMYKKLKGHINNNYKWLEAITATTNQIIEGSTLVINNSK